MPRVLILAVALLCPLARAQDPVAPPPKPPTDAERVAQVSRTLEKITATLKEVEDELNDPGSDYAKAEAAFKKLEARLTAGREGVKKLLADGKASEAAAAEEALKPLVAERDRARDLFDLELTRRKALQDKRATLVAAAARNQQLLAELRGAPKPVDPPKAPDPKAKDPPAKDPNGPTAPTAPDAKPPAAKAESKPDPEVQAARAVADARKAALAESERGAKSIEERVQVLRQLIQTEEKLMGAERKVADRAETDLARLTAGLRDVPPAGRDDAHAEVAAVQKRLAAARARVAVVTERIAALNVRLHEREQEHIRALQQVDANRSEVASADRELERLADPLAARNVTQWLVTHGVNMVLIAVGVVVLHLIVRQSSRRIVRLASRNSRRGSDEERENRASTLVGVFRYVGALVIFGGGVVMLLDEAGVPVVPLMGGAAVFGLAVAFGAQNLIKDYFCGFMMLLEDQYSVNDVVRIGAVSGLVEKITLRVTVLRDLEGVLHFVPHGQVTTVSNMTHGWSRALFDIPVPHSADTDALMAEFAALTRALWAEPAFASRIIEDPEMLGVEVLDPTAVVIRFIVKTKPLQQWAVKRELLKRINARLRELGVPVAPSRVIELRGDAGAPAEGRTARSNLDWPLGR